MTVAELIELLKTLPDDARIAVRDRYYSDDFTPAETLRTMSDEDAQLYGLSGECRWVILD